MSDQGSRDEKAKKVILARRARFVAAAMAGVGLACGKATTPEPCLSVAYVRDGEAPPGPCLAVPFEGFADAGASANGDAGADAGANAGAAVKKLPPRVPPPGPPPRPCLTPLAPKLPRSE